jgi:hypothetical protein
MGQGQEVRAPACTSAAAGRWVVTAKLSPNARCHCHPARAFKPRLPTPTQVIARKYVATAAAEGQWVLLQNTHLGLGYLSEVEAVLTKTEELHDSFRWGEGGGVTKRPGAGGGWFWTSGVVQGGRALAARLAAAWWSGADAVPRTPSGQPQAVDHRRAAPSVPHRPAAGWGCGGGGDWGAA